VARIASMRAAVSVQVYLDTDHISVLGQASEDGVIKWEFGSGASLCSNSGDATGPGYDLAKLHILYDAFFNAILVAVNPETWVCL
jgi:hypothetical protein